MKTTLLEQLNLQLTHELGKEFEKRAPKYDREGSFVKENYEDLKANGYFIAMIPEELGGLGISFSEMANHIRIIGQYDGSTALALSMHSHLIAANVWKYKKGQGGDDVLKKVVDKDLVLISTGARDWLESNGEMTKVEGGYVVSGKKFFASQSAYADVAVTSAPYHHPEEGWQVLHFSVPMNSEGVSTKNDWDTMGMRGTGSQTIEFDNVFVKEEAIGLTRPQGEFHPFWDVVLTVAMPLISSAYVGIAQKAYEKAIGGAQKSYRQKPHVVYQVGEIKNKLVNLEVIWKDMVSITNNFDFDPADENSSEILIRKTLIANGAMDVVNQAIDIAGGGAYYRKTGLERLFRDVQAVRFHPLQEKDQQKWVGERILNR